MLVKSGGGLMVWVMDWITISKYGMRVGVESVGVLFRVAHVGFVGGCVDASKSSIRVAEGKWVCFWFR
jgi:hypothetical protein